MSAPALRQLDLPAGRFQILEQPAASGDPTARLVLCVHGFPDIPRGFTPLMQALAQAGFRSAAPWLRGYAPSHLAGPYHFTRIAEDLRELADALSPQAPIHVVGHDWGAVASYALCALWPERVSLAVTLSVPHPLHFRRAMLLERSQLRRSWYFFAFQLRIVAERWLARNDGALIARLWRDWSPGWTPEPAYLREVVDTVIRSLPAPIAYYRALLPGPSGFAASLRADRALRTLRTPFLYLHGADDGCIGAEVGSGQDVHFAGPFESRILPGLGHFLHLEDPAGVNPHIVDWLKGI